jgi:hypothetical protein
MLETILAIIIGVAAVGGTIYIRFFSGAPGLFGGQRRKRK